MLDVGANYRTILNRIADAAARSGRDPAAIKLLAAAKSQDVELIRAAIQAGVRIIGENYVQEAQVKMAAIEASVEWHMIGHMQRNKAKAAVEVFDVIQSLDSLVLARALEREGQRSDKKIRTFVEVNLAGEETKSGIPPDRVKSLLRDLTSFPHVSVEGLMAVPPFREKVEDIRPYFRALRELQLELQELHIPNVELRELSMGMTHDYPVAIEEGATMVRIGTALFGPRKG